jgi:hypothetical protein
MAMKRNAISLGIGTIALLLVSCTSPEPAKPTPPPVKPAPVAEAAKPVDAGLTKMERDWAILKAKRAEEEKLAKELAEQEKVRLRKFDQSNLPKHIALLAFEKKTRKELDDLAEKVKGKPDAAAQIEKLSQKQRKAIEAQGKALQKIDPTGGNSNIGTDHDVSLNLLANDYPAALAAAAAGDEKPLADARKELDKRLQKMDAWLAEVKQAKK